MTKRVYKSFPQSLIRNFKVFLTLKTMIGYLAAKVKMLNKESHSGIKEVEKATLNMLIVDKFILVSSYETGHSKSELWIFINIVREQHDSTICRHTVLQ